MPVKTCEGKYIDVPLSQCFGKKCTDGKFHVILDDGACGIWMSEAEVLTEDERNAEAMRHWLYEPMKRKVSFK